MASLPPTPWLFVDVETTGLSREDRIVSLGAVRVDSLNQLDAEKSDFAALHLIFNPGRPSDPRAAKVHGYSDAELALQEVFEEYATPLAEWFNGAGTIIAHNSSFDERFIRNAFKPTGVKIPKQRFFCTMQAYRRQYDGSAALKAILAQMGIQRQRKTHGALEDAWLAMNVFAWLHDVGSPGVPPNLPAPVNYRSAAISAPTQQPQTDSTPPAGHRDAEKLLNGALPAGTLMMAVANADQSVTAEEIAVLYVMLTEKAEALGIDDDPELFGQVFANLATLRPTSEDIRSAATRIIANAHDRTNISAWLKQITYADGEGSTDEVGIIHEISAALRDAHGAA